MNNLSWMAFSRSAVGAAVAIVVAAPVLAQNTTSAIGGRVAGADGNGIAGVSVAILHVESGSLVTTSTNADGRYLARGLRVGGPYTITFSKDGLSDKREGVFLALAETLALDTTLGNQVTTITVTGRGVSDKFNRSNMGATTSIGSRELNAQASIARNLQDYARTDPRLSQTDKERGEISVAGQNSRFNSITIDGVKINDTFGLEANNLPTAKQPITIEAIQSVQVNVSNYDATQKGYTGANINAVTKSGTNELKGSLYYVWRNQDLAGNRLTDRVKNTYNPPAPFKEATTGFTLGGPLVQDKLFFFVSYEELKSSRNAPAYGPLGSSLTNVGITPTLISGLQNIAKSQYGIDLGDSNTPSGVNLVVKDTLLKLDWNISDNHRANLRYTKTAQTEPIFPNFSTTQISLSTNWYVQEKEIETLVGQWFADWTPTFSTELKFSKRDYDSVPNNNARLPQMAFAVSGPLPPGSTASASTRTLYTGTESSRHFNILRTKTDDAYAAANWQLGDHELKFGGDVSRNKIFNAFLQNTFGNYTFSCVNSSATYAYSGAVPVTPGATNPGGVDCSNAAQVEAAILENFRLGRPSTYTAQVPQTGRTLEDGVAGWTLTETGLYAQDTWNLSKQFTLMAGVRVDNQSTGQTPVANASAAQAYVPGNPSTNTRASGGFGRDNTATLDGEQLVQPRFGFNYNLPTESRMQLRGGFGLFQGAAATVWLSNPFSNPGVATTTVTCTSGPTPCDPNGGTFSPNPDAQPGLSAFPGAIPAANVDFIEKGLGQPSVWKANLAFEAELPWSGIVASAEWMFTKTQQGIYYQNLNLGPVMATGPDGRELYYNTQGLNPACYNPTTGATITTGTTCSGLSNRALRNLSYNNVLLAAETKKGGGNAITLALSQPARDGFAWSAAYTRMTSKEVSPLTSSTSFSNWGGRSIFNPNEEVEANSAYLVRDRWNGSLSFSRAFVDKYRTTVGLFYEGRKGKPYSWTYNNDLNGDSVSGNDLMYIPKGQGSGEVVFTGAGEQAFWDIVNQFDELKNSKGGVVKRNGSFSPFVNTFDLRLAQEMPGLFGNNKATITLDILNIGNLLNSRWGRTDEIAFQSGGGAARSFVNYAGVDSSGRYVYNVIGLEDYATRQAKGESQWAAQITLRYEF